MSQHDDPRPSNFSFGDVDVAWCPEAASFPPYPSTVVVFFIIGVASIGAAIVTIWRYNSVEVFRKAYRSAVVSNVMWALYFSSIAVAYLLQAFEFLYSDGRPSEHTTFSRYLEVPAEIFRSFTACALVLALRHQYTHRTLPSPEGGTINAGRRPSTASPEPIIAADRKQPHWQQQQHESQLYSGYGSLASPPPGVSPHGTMPLGHAHASSPGSPTASSSLLPSSAPAVGLLRRIFSFNVLFVALFLFTAAAIVLKDGDTDPTRRTLYISLLLAGFFAQRAAVLGVAIVIALHSGVGGPSPRSRIQLLVGIVMNIACDWPLFLWSWVLPPSCTLSFASALDMISLLFLASLVILAAFMRGEFLRNKGETIWNRVSQIQSTFDFRQF